MPSLRRAGRDHPARPFAGGEEGALHIDREQPVECLDIEPEHLHQRIPLVFGSAREVERIARYHIEPSAIGERAPLFGNRGLFRA